MSKVYVKTDSENRIIEINSDIFLFNMSEYTLIDEGDGDKYYHAQSHYLLNGLIDSHGCYNYKLVDGEVAERTLGEKARELTTIQNAAKIVKLKKNLYNTDYAVIKIAEGAATVEEYAEVIAQRQAWREEINQLENSVD